MPFEKQKDETIDMFDRYKLPLTPFRLTENEEGPKPEELESTANSYFETWKDVLDKLEIKTINPQAVGEQLNAFDGRLTVLISQAKPFTKYNREDLEMNTKSVKELLNYCQADDKNREYVSDYLDQKIRKLAILSTNIRQSENKIRAKSENQSTTISGGELSPEALQEMVDENEKEITEIIRQLATPAFFELTRKRFENKPTKTIFGDPAIFLPEIIKQNQILTEVLTYLHKTADNK